MHTCPLCGSSIVYMGLNTVECSGSGCDNHTKAQKPWIEVFRKALQSANEKEILDLHNQIKSGAVNKTNYRTLVPTLRWFKRNLP